MCVTSTREDLHRLARGERPDKLIDSTTLAIAGEQGTVAEWNNYFRFRLPIHDGYFARSVVSDFRPYAATEFVTDFVRPRSVDLCLGGWFRRYTVVVPRCRPARPFSEQEIGISRIIAPHLENFYCLLCFASGDPEIYRMHALRAKAARAGLTRREQEIAILLSERLSMPEIADRLCISCRTVETHAAHIYAKMGIRKKRELGDHLLGSTVNFEPIQFR
jgi:DNA-binding CsgD family transcriptional regulator